MLLLSRLLGKKNAINKWKVRHNGSENEAGQDGQVRKWNGTRNVDPRRTSFFHRLPVMVDQIARLLRQEGALGDPVRSAGLLQKQLEQRYDLLVLFFFQPSAEEAVDHRFAQVVLVLFRPPDHVVGRQSCDVGGQKLKKKLTDRSIQRFTNEATVFQHRRLDLIDRIHRLLAQTRIAPGNGFAAFLFVVRVTCKINSTNQKVFFYEKNSVQFYVVAVFSLSCSMTFSIGRL